MTKKTRLGAYGGPRSLYGTFSGKESAGNTQDIQPTGIASAEAFGTPVITSVVDIAPTGIASAEAFGVPVVDPGIPNIVPTGIPSAEAFGIPSVTGGAIIKAETQFGKKFYELNRAKLSLQMRQEDEEILAIAQIIGKYLL